MGPRFEHVSCSISTEVDVEVDVLALIPNMSNEDLDIVERRVRKELAARGVSPGTSSEGLEEHLRNCEWATRRRKETR